MTPDFSIVIPSCNRPRQLAGCLQSIAELDFPKNRFEVIVIDDGGDQPAAPVVARFENDLAVTVRRQSRQGPAAARNFGASLAAGRFLAFTDDDCRPEAGWLSAYSAAFRDRPEILAGGATVNALPSNPYSAASQLIQDVVYAYYNADPDRARFFASNNLAISAAAFDSTGGFNPGFQTSEDRDFCDRWYDSERRLVCVPEAVVLHAHGMNLREFWNQHIGYGRGARRFYLAHKRRHPGSTTIDGSFYAGLLTRVPGLLHREANPLRVAGLLTIWPAANITGFAAETLCPRTSPLRVPRRARETA